MRSAECGVRSAECGVRSVENMECRKMRNVKEKYIKSLKERNKVISPHVGITPNITPSRLMPPVRTLEKHSTLNEMKKIIFLFVCFQNREI